MKALTPNRPYLLRAYYDWLMDNQLTPHVVVDAFVKGTQVPQQYVKDGQIVLNIAAGAVGNLQIGNEFVEFNARFGGVPQQVLLPMASIVAIYARENGAGTVFDIEDAYLVEEEAESALSIIETKDKPTEPTDEPPKRRSHLTLVK
ncbi:ClpXP protease specificity-enhancing factor [Shewanella xiamenensis]|jgi:stringent starvation protein B|uniref:Stringent starvation protein B n=1 Tax=Shewanella xiamenensis TaxID=332186 RepID=A0A073KTC4_9GAMM|nr:MULTISPECIES: ClpXP protease specificity-enhancing factor [Shewanella]ASF15816.1 ClpXP protease specificity-enhancing factor [Shewanella sp. FDAARGOS_354]KEK29736.1 ClpXP protease specificity-enhancing factor [Shewanella xiamenensis]KPN77832.1 peptidase [Shewanella sp. Sh95]MBW0278917.1 stringent starvation protein B [Shewanella xiamenensis]MCD8550104.1 ClpXP protease specificity-enhancing factor [Shewanella xiamenensis]